MQVIKVLEETNYKYTFETKVKTRFTVSQTGLISEIANLKISEVSYWNGSSYNKLINSDNKHSQNLTLKGWIIHIKVNLSLIKSIEIIFNANKKGFEIYFHIYQDLLNWQKSYSFAGFYEVLSSNLNSKNNLGVIRLSPVPSQKYPIGFLTQKEELTIAEVVYEYSSRLNEIYGESEKRINDRVSNSSLIKYFDFPHELKTPCEQYLLYFAHFLRDLGINATSNLQEEEAGKVLFSVTPTDDVEALDKIREALAVYLTLPSSPIVDAEYSENFALMRIQQQVRNLQHSQQMLKTELLSTEYALRLAQQNIENQDRIIIQQNVTNENLNKIIEKISSPTVMIDSLENEDEIVQVCKGLKIGESKFLKEQFGAHFNPAKFIKGLLENTFGKQETISILGSENELDGKDN